jgi:hypothetical protein
MYPDHERKSRSKGGSVFGEAKPMVGTLCIRPSVCCANTLPPTFARLWKTLLPFAFFSLSACNFVEQRFLRDKMNA